MRSIFAAEASCSTGSTLLHLLHHVVGAIPLQLFLDLDSDETNGVVLQRDRNRHVLQMPSGRRGQHRQLSPECQRHVGEGRTPFGLQARRERKTSGEAINTFGLQARPLVPLAARGRSALTS